MAELTQKEKLQPSLLDRLTDNNPESQVESRAQRVLSIQQLRKSVIRDLGWLLNTGNLEARQNLDRYPAATHSVVNYGMPDIAGITTGDIEVDAVEQAVKQAIIDFEPRILRNTLMVKMVVDQEAMSSNSVVFEIEGELWAQPVPLRVFLKTELDLETGDVKVADRS
ncbi:MAG: type VI secretion system baseplate subunit TssE [Gammaproteobacteria bacterium]|jgi:type VI secretion system protein ImpF